MRCGWASNQFHASQQASITAFWLNPKVPIPHSRIAEAAEALNLPSEEIQRRYEVLAQQFGLTLEWKQ